MSFKLNHKQFAMKIITKLRPAPPETRLQVHIKALYDEINALLRGMSPKTGDTKGIKSACPFKQGRVGYQNILMLTYVDKLIDDVHREFRDKYRNQIQQRGILGLLSGSFDFHDDFELLLRAAEDASRVRPPGAMKTFAESQKSQKTVKSMIEKPADRAKENNKKNNKASKKESECGGGGRGVPLGIGGSRRPAGDWGGGRGVRLVIGEGVAASGSWLWSPLTGFLRCWVWISGRRAVVSQCPVLLLLRFAGGVGVVVVLLRFVVTDHVFLNSFSSKRSGFGGMLGMLKGLVGAKSLTLEDMEPVLEKMKDHLIAKNVAVDIALQLCESVAKKLEGKVMGTFSTVTSAVKQALQESLVQILQPKRRVDVLRDVMEAQRLRHPYVITFCGVNGVGKSTNLAKISFWLIENGFSVLIAACDTFRAGAVEQLRTHTRRLNSLHPPEEHKGRAMVQLYEKGYGKDAAGIAMEAILYARNQGFDVVLVDTAGRMQDNAPLMTALAKLIAVNTPDLVLFVGEALVGNEAVDQLVKFNKALADHSMADKPHLIDGIVLTKFDTIDDKVGAAISMTYITGQPIVFVGTGQTYCDLRSLNAKAVVAALMKA
uniref:SRP receptor subunit alpha n=1 Tax=Leptobrachium leishanense TaxID=445787 RepID=A0A8C5MXW9_9ANUR